MPNEPQEPTCSAWINTIAGYGAHYVARNPVNPEFAASLVEIFGEPVITDAPTEMAARKICAQRYGCPVPMTINGAPQ